MAEDLFVAAALEAAQEILAAPLSIERGAVLLYQVTVDNRLSLTVDPRSPRRGQAAFQTDLCVFDEVDPGVRIPRVVLEFKPGLTTHDMLTYSAKARKHKQVYPYLRYGIVVGSADSLPGRFFRHNEGLDFGVAAASYRERRLVELFRWLLKDEVAESRTLEKIAFDRSKPKVFRTAIVLKSDSGKVV